MSYCGRDSGKLSYEMCRYGASRLVFRGPAPDLEAPYIAFIGTTETQAPFLPRPYSEITAEFCESGCANLGLRNSGPDAFLGDQDVLRVACRAEVVVIELMGAINLSNRFYKVHPRRNDRFTRPLDPLLRMVPNFEMTDVHFTGHLLAELRRIAPEVQPVVLAELQACWVERMSALIATFEAPVHLLWTQPEEGNAATLDRTPGVDLSMVRQIARGAASVTRVRPSAVAIEQGAKEMVFAPMQAAAAATMLSAQTHREIAATLGHAIGSKRSRIVKRQA